MLVSPGPLKLLFEAAVSVSGLFSSSIAFSFGPVESGLSLGILLGHQRPKPSTLLNPSPTLPPLLLLLLLFLMAVVHDEVKEPALPFNVRGDGNSGGRGGVGNFERSDGYDPFFGVGMAGKTMLDGSWYFPVVILPRPLIAWPMLSLRRRSAEKDFLRCMDRRLLARGSDALSSSLSSSSAGGVGNDGKAVMAAVLPSYAAWLDMLLDVGGRCMDARLLELVENVALFIRGNASTVDAMLEVEGRLTWLDGREENEAVVGVLMKDLMLLMRA
jgi:hypothetical protein